MRFLKLAFLLFGTTLLLATGCARKGDKGGVVLSDSTTKGGVTFNLPGGANRLTITPSTPGPTATLLDVTSPVAIEVIPFAPGAPVMVNPTHRYVVTLSEKYFYSRGTDTPPTTKWEFSNDPTFPPGCRGITVVSE